METIKAFLFGLTLAISIGPIAILIINTGLSSGLKNGLMSGLGAAFADLTYSILAFTVGTLLVSFLNLNQQYFALSTSFVLILFGLWMLKGSLRLGENVSKNSETVQKPGTNYLLSTYLLTVVNPLTIVAFLGFSGQLVSPVMPLYQVLFLSLSIFAGSILVQSALACFGATLGRIFHNPGVVRVLNIGSSLSIIGFGAAGLFQV
ncbi:LysE family translocator [Pontibacter ruber]|uniref:LysE family translocator n=1 Tax=Pontibacter ruber TaxID=1343895 RepID=A0ABW5CQX0_9BACT|nr:LysE family transporter [Pontibacter ruber]